MTRIISPDIGHLEGHSWVKANQSKIEGHQAWWESIDTVGAETLLQGKDPFTYLLRKGEGDLTYFISFVKKDRSIKHQKFTLEYGQELYRRGWFYRNGGLDSPTELISHHLEELIFQMMHCDAKVPKPLRQF